jgi:hypothetical protein
MRTGWLSHARWSVLGRQLAGTRDSSGQERSPSDSSELQVASPWASSRGRRKPGQWSSSLAPGCRESFRALARESVATEDGPHRWTSWSRRR